MNRQRRMRISLFNIWIFASTEAVVMGESWGKARYALCWVKERWKTICFSRSSSCKCVVMKTIWGLWQGFWERNCGLFLMNKHKRRRIVWQTMWSCNALIAFGAGVLFAVGCIDFKLLLEWLVNEHKGRTRRVVANLLGRPFVVVMPWSPLGQGCLLQLDVLTLNSCWSGWCRGGGGW